MRLPLAAAMSMVVMSIAWVEALEAQMPARETIPANSPVKDQLYRLYAPDPVERGKAASELQSVFGGMLGIESAAPFLIGLLADDSKLRVENRSGPGLVVGYLDTSVGEIAAKALETILLPGDELPDALIAALRDQRPYVRVNVALALRGKRAGIESLLRLVRDSDAAVRSQAAQSLMLSKDHRAVDALIEALGDSESSVRSSARTALREIAGADLGPGPASWRAWWEKRRRQEQ